VHLEFWQPHKDGVWHVHVLTNVAFHVNELRPWMVARGWGKMCRVELVPGKKACGNPPNPERVRLAERRFKYLTRYVARDVTRFGVEEERGARRFSGPRRAVGGTTAFKWAPWEKAGAYLWAMGLALFVQLYGHSPKWCDMSHVVRLGVEETQWQLVDPWWEFSVPST
jgi:hypothetical protein